MKIEEFRKLAGLTEKWNKEVHVAPSEKGKHSHKPMATLRRQLSAAKGSGNTSLMRELNFAIRAKSHWGKVKEAQWHIDLTREEQVLLETHDEDGDDDMSAAEKELASTADSALKKKGVDVEGDVAAAVKKDKAIAAAKPKAKAAPKAAKKPVAAAPAPEVKKDEPAAPAAEAPKAAEAPAAEEPKTDAEKAAVAKKKIHHAMEWIKKNKEATRRQFMDAAGAWGMGKAYASSYHRILHRKVHGNPDIKEGFILLHPEVSRFALALNKQFNRYQWINLEEGNGLDPLITFSLQEAERVATYVREQMSQNVDITCLPTYDD